MLRNVLIAGLLAFGIHPAVAQPEIDEELLRKLEEYTPQEFLTEFGALRPDGSYVDGATAAALVASDEYTFEIRVRQETRVEPYVQLLEVTDEIRASRREARRAESRVDAIGQLWPFPRFQSLDGQEFDLEGSDAPEVTIVDFWFTVCSPCVQALPELNAIQAKYADHPVAFIAPTFEDNRTTRRFLDRHEFNFAVVTRKKKWFQQVIGQVRAPTYLWINEDNVIEAELSSPAEIEARLARRFPGEAVTARPEG